MEFDLRLLAVAIDRLRLDLVHHRVGHGVAATAPRVDDLVVFLLLRDQAVLILLFVIGDQCLGFVDLAILGIGDDHVVLAEGDAGLERVAEAQRHDRIGEQYRVLLPGVAIDLIDHVADFLLGQQAVDDVEGHLVVLRQAFADQQAARVVTNRLWTILPFSSACGTRVMTLEWYVTAPISNA